MQWENARQYTFQHELPHVTKWKLYITLFVSEHLEGLQALDSTAGRQNKGTRWWPVVQPVTCTLPTYLPLLCPKLLPFARLQNSWILQHNTVGPSQWTQQTATPLSSCSILVMASLKLSEMTSFLSQYLAVLFHLCSAARQFRVRRLPTTSALPVSAFFSKFFLTSLSRVL